MRNLVMNILMGPAAPTQEQKTQWIIKDDVSSRRQPSYVYSLWIILGD